MVLLIIVIIIFIIAALVLITCLSISHVTGSRKPEDGRLAIRDEWIRILERCKHLSGNTSIDSGIDKVLDEIRYGDPVYPAGTENLSRSITRSINELSDEIRGGMEDMALKTLDQIENMVEEMKLITQTYKK